MYERSWTIHIAGAGGNSNKVLGAEGLNGGTIGSAQRSTTSWRASEHFRGVWSALFQASNEVHSQLSDTLIHAE